MIDKNGWDSSKTMPLLLAGVALLALYWPVLRTLVGEWETNDNYSHGYFIPIIFAYMIYRVKDKLLEKHFHPANTGLVFIAVGFAVLIIAKIGSEFFLQRSSFIVVLLGLVLFLMGRDYFKTLSLPILYLILMIPLPAIIWNKITFPAQLFSSYLTEQVIRFLGIPVFREGNILHLSETTLEVVAACSGLRSLVTMFVVSSLLAWMSPLPSARRWLIFFAAVPTAIVVNILRLTMTAILASLYGSQVAQGFLHDFSGVITSIVGLILLLLVQKVIGRYQ